jgi:hypothetical protein
MLFACGKENIVFVPGFILANACHAEIIRTPSTMLVAIVSHPQHNEFFFSYFPYLTPKFGLCPVALAFQPQSVPYGASSALP